VFMFASTHPQEFPPAILSRLQRFDVRRLTTDEIEGKLRRILDADGREADDAAIHLIARLAAGGMRDAESMLDQLLSTAHDRIDEAHVRDLLGLADAEVIAAFVDHLVRGDAAAGVALLDALDERGRDVRALLDQVVEAIRLDLVAGLADPTAARHDPAALAEAGRRIAAIDPNRAGIGGLRFQLELALFRSGGGSPVPRAGPTPSIETSTAKTSAEASKAQPPAPVTEPAIAAAQPARPAEAAAPAKTARPAPPMPSPEAAAVPPTPAEPPRPAPTTLPGPTTGSPDSGSPDLDRLAAGWAAVVASVGPATRAVITECRPLSVDGNVVTLGFPEAKGFLKDVAERKAKELDAAVGGFLGRAVSVRCVATNIEIAATPTDAAYVLAEARRIFADDIVDVGEVT
jgi:DNA polymerase III subunit gamma/tau